MKSTRIAFFAWLLFSATAHAAFTDADWISIPGVDGYINALAVDASGNIYIGGGFTKIGNTPAACVAKWDGTNWSALGTGLAGGAYPGANALVLTNGLLFVGGYFATAGGVSANGIAEWDGANWSSLGSGVSGGESVINSLLMSGNFLYAGGEFTNVTWRGSPERRGLGWNQLSLPRAWSG